jgi:Ca2+-dependent lipid-binding protein
VHLIRGTDLPAKDGYGSTATSDPVCILKCNDGVSANEQVKMSTVKMKELNPEWKEDFSFSVESVFGQLELVVEDDDMLSNDFMGKIVLPIATLWNQAEWRFDNYPLSSKVRPTTCRFLSVALTPMSHHRRVCRR